MQSDEWQSEQEKRRDYQRAEADIERILKRIESGMATKQDADEIRTITRMLGVRNGTE